MKNVETANLIKEIDSMLAVATDQVDIAQLKMLRQWVLNGRN
jgi:hypothetical protein